LFPARHTWHRVRPVKVQYIKITNNDG
jgi:hypothetical protein